MWPCATMSLLGELFCHVLYILFDETTEVLVFYQSCFDETQMFCQILEAKSIKKEINAFKRCSACLSNYQLSIHCQILANVRAVNIHDST